jgi:3D (Asp-Asp-Asp) domain-containing protein
MKVLITTLGLVLVFFCQLFGDDRTAKARVTAYWRGEGGSSKGAATGAALREGHCAVDPKKIPYGSKVAFGDGECTATDTGPAVTKRKAARVSGRTADERNAIVIDRFFDSKQKAAAWTKSHPKFMNVRIRTADAQQGTN